MAKQSKSRGKPGSKSESRAAAPSKSAPEKSGEDGAHDDSPRDPLAAFPADPPRRNLPLLIIAAALFAAWFCYLAYIALGI